jgi:SAM-dependent methyltransferase
MTDMTSAQPGGSAQEPSGWAQGDGGQILKFQQQNADEFVASLGLQPGQRVLDVACGVGNAAVAAARAGAVATGLDIAEQAIEQARARVASQGLAIRFDVASFESMPYDDASFDVLLSMFGVMFAPHPERAAAELARVCRPGGLIALANWPPDSLIAQLFRTVTRYVPPPPGPSPFAWGQEEPVRNWLGPLGTDLRGRREPYALRFPFPPDRAAAAIRDSIGPVRQSLAALDPERKAALQADLEHLFVEQNRATDGSTDIPSEYLDARGRRR